MVDPDIMCVFECLASLHRGIMPWRGCPAAQRRSGTTRSSASAAATATPSSAPSAPPMPLLHCPALCVPPRELGVSGQRYGSAVPYHAGRTCQEVCRNPHHRPCDAVYPLGVTSAPLDVFKGVSRPELRIHVRFAGTLTHGSVQCKLSIQRQQ